MTDKLTDSVTAHQVHIATLKTKIAILRKTNAGLILKLDALRQSAHAAADDLAGEVLTLRAENEELRRLLIAGEA